MKNAEKNTCKTCHKLYWFVSGGGGTIQDREDYHCPYCGALEGRERTGGLPRTYKITPEEEAASSAKK